MTREETKRELELFPSRYAVNGTVDKIYEIFEAELKAKDQAISSLMDLQDNWIAERADLQAVIEKQGERIRYLESQLKLHYEE